jgi:LPXTG-motif cell wall-anchored protein
LAFAKLRWLTHRDHFGVSMTSRAGLAVTALSAGAFALLAALPAAAAPPDAPVSGDARATAHAGNITTCPTGSIVKVGATVDPTNTFVTITSVPADVELISIIVKGGPGYNVYPAGALTQLHSPLVGKDDKNIPTISHWFACGTKKSVSSSSNASTPPSSSTPGGGNGSTGGTGTGGPGGSGTGGSGTETNADLANTGFSATGPLIGAGALLLAGGALLFTVRRRQRG